MRESSPSSASALVARELSKSYGGQTVLDGVDLVASPGLPVGVVGENGVGKSTLLRLLAGIEGADAGEVLLPAGLAYLPQEPTFASSTRVADVLTEALRPLHDGVDRLEQLAAGLEDPQTGAEYAGLLDWAVLHDAWGADRRAEAAADRLGVGALDPLAPVSTLSGGQRSRLGLAALVARRSSCVLLDEPTNHLDDAGVDLLEEFLTGLPGVVVVASHDRAFLESVCREVFDLDPSHFGTDGRGGGRFSGGYADYLAVKREARLRWERAFSSQRSELGALRTAARVSNRRVAHDRPPRDGDKFIYHAKGEKVAQTISRRVRDSEKRIEAIEQDLIEKPPRELSFRGAMGSIRAGGQAVFVRDLVVRGRVSVPSLDVASGEQLLVTGANGAGKSSLLEVLAGSLMAESGAVTVSARRVGYLPQHVTFRRPDRTCHEVYVGLTGAEVPLRDLGLVHPRDVGKPVGLLSVGQQRRLALAVVVAQQPDLLLLDEPTNHISLVLADELEEALQSTTCTAVLASHDRWLRRGWQGSTLAL
ncbi:ABC-F family ATP-binding cassette domain-containing protein [soil metagenome]